MNESVSRYLIVGEGFYPEEFLINDLVKEWEKSGYNLEVLTRAPSYPFGKVFSGYKNKLYQREKWGNVLIHRFPVIPGYNKNTIIKILNYLSFVIFGSLIGIFIARRYERIFIYHTGPLSLAIPGILIKKISRAPVTIWSFDLWPATVYAYGFKKTRILSWFLDSFVKWIYKNCDNIIVSSQGFVPELKKYVLDKPVYFAPNWPQISNINSKKSSIILPLDTFHFTFTGNVGKVQNLENVIIGFRNASIKNAQLNIFGDGSNLGLLKKLVAQENIENVVFHGRIPLSEIADIMDQSDVLVISLIPDAVMELTLPLKFQTYLTASKPIFGIMLGEVNRLITNYHIGEVASPESIEEISDGFKKFAISPVINEEITKKCQILLNSIYDRNKIIKLITSVFLGSAK